MKLSIKGLNNRTFPVLLLFLGATVVAFLSCQKEGYSPDYDFSSFYPEPQLDSIIVNYCCNESAHEQLRDAPSESLAQRFNSDFHGAYDVVWCALGNFYGVQFKLDYTNYKAIYDYKDELLMVKIELQKSEVPKKITNKMKDKYGKSWEVGTAYEVFTAYSSIYELIIEHEDNRLKCFFFENGSFLDEC